MTGDYQFHYIHIVQTYSSHNNNTYYVFNTVDDIESAFIGIVNYVCQHHKYNAYSIIYLDCYYNIYIFQYISQLHFYLVSYTTLIYALYLVK